MGIDFGELQNRSCSPPSLCQPSIYVNPFVLPMSSSTIKVMTLGQECDSKVGYY